VLFLDIVGFTRISDRIPPGHVVHLLEQIFTTLDAVCERHGVMKIKTIGDSYMAVAFSNTEDQTPKNGHVVSAAQCAVEMLAALNTLEVTMPPDLGDTSWTNTIDDINVRIGLHCGPVTAGVIGTQRLQYDVWGDTVNVASRMESHGEPGRIHVSEAFASALLSEGGGQRAEGKRNGSVTSESLTIFNRGQISIKGKGEMTTYWLTASA
jgi:class 3 adenylate cyclase